MDVVAVTRPTQCTQCETLRDAVRIWSTW